MAHGREGLRKPASSGNEISSLGGKIRKAATDVHGSTLMTRFVPSVKISVHPWLDVG